MKKWFKLETLVSFSAFVMSVCAIVISFAEVRMMSEQKEASVWPRLFSARNTSNLDFVVTVRNSGVGPAQIKSVEVTVDGKPVKNWNEVIGLIDPQTKVAKSQSVLTNLVLVPGETVEAFKLKGDGVDVFNLQRSRLRLKLCYCSIYEKCWVLDESVERNAGLAVPYPVEACKIDKTAQFLL